MDHITSVKNPTIQMLRSLKDRKGREQSGCFLVEGEVMIREALSCALSPRALIACEQSAAFAESLAIKNAAIVPDSILRTVCETDTPQGICAAFDMPKPLPPEKTPERIIALDGVQDPGNVGTIWRTADAAGFQALCAGKGCADLLSPKVQRSAMGSGFRVPFWRSDNLSDTLADLRRRGWTVIASDLHGTDFYSHPPIGEKFVLIIGSEARGISDQVRAAADIALKLPMRGGAESLNAAVAAGIMMYELTKSL